jgi:transposase InsO family protein
LRNSWLYLVAILDWFSRYVVSWALSDTLSLPFVLEAVEVALHIATPQIWNTDQGSQFTSPHRVLGPSVKHFVRVTGGTRTENWLSHCA